MVVFVETAVMDDHHLDQFPEFPSVKDRLMTFRLGKDDLTDKIDFIVCLGGDGKKSLFVSPLVTIQDVPTLFRPYITSPFIY